LAVCFHLVAEVEICLIFSLLSGLNLLSVSLTNRNIIHLKTFVKLNCQKNFQGEFMGIGEGGSNLVPAPDRKFPSTGGAGNLGGYAALGFRGGCGFR
jgi:hypothetical protein